jgi:catechol 2,3-dioxygenase-like lactoylglutathione lyase family enzyme
MIPIEGLFETHITVSDLQRSITFYRDVVGLEVGLLQPERPAAFFWVGGRGRSMLGVFSLGSCPLTMRHHLAFQVKLEDVLAAPLKLRSAGIAPLGGDREPIDEPVVFAWGPAASVFFDDLDGNLLEYISMLSNPPRPELGLVSWSKWQALHENRRD